MSSKYDDIINLPHHQSDKHPHMTMKQRAAQFAPFAALAGYAESIGEAHRQTDEFAALDATVIGYSQGWWSVSDGDHTNQKDRQIYERAYLGRRLKAPHPKHHRDSAKPRNAIVRTSKIIS